MSVDDLISDVVRFVEEELQAGSRTYFMYSSDHGFQLGQFNIPMDKRQAYEWSTKIHLLARGPGIVPGSSFSALGTNVDVAPTILGLAGLAIPKTMDGKSVVPFLMPGCGAEVTGRRLQMRTDMPASFQEVMASTCEHLSNLGDLVAYRKQWREEVFL
eukprot:5132644-Amphidinium_carterae.1